MARVQAVALCDSELWYDHSEVGRRDDLQLLLNRQATSSQRALPETLRGALMSESGLTQAPVIFDIRQQRFAARLENACCSKLKELHKIPASGAPICRVIRKELEHSRTNKSMNWPAPGSVSNGSSFGPGGYYRSAWQRPYPIKNRRFFKRTITLRPPILIREYSVWYVKYAALHGASFGRLRFSISLNLSKRQPKNLVFTPKMTIISNQLAEF